MNGLGGNNSQPYGVQADNELSRYPPIPSVQYNTGAPPTFKNDPAFDQVSAQPFSTVAEGTISRDIPGSPGSPLNRKRRQGRDHTNWPPPPNLSVLLRDSLDTRHDLDTGNINNNGHAMSSSGFMQADESGEEGLQLIVLDKTDDEDDNLDIVPPPLNDNVISGGHTSRTNSHVFPVDRMAVERDLFKQEYAPPPSQTVDMENSGRKISKSGFINLNGHAHVRNDGTHNLNVRQKTVHGGFHAIPSDVFPADSIRSRSVGDGFLAHSQIQQSLDTDAVPTARLDAFNNNINSSLDLDTGRNTQGGYVQGQGQRHVPRFVYNITDFDSPVGPTSLNPVAGISDGNFPNQGVHPHQMVTPGQQSSLLVPSPSSRSLRSNHPHPQDPLTNADQQRPVFAISQVDYDRFTSVPPGISTVREDIGRDETTARPKVSAVLC